MESFLWIYWRMNLSFITAPQFLFKLNHLRIKRHPQGRLLRAVGEEWWILPVDSSGCVSSHKQSRQWAPLPSQHGLEPAMDLKQMSFRAPAAVLGTRLRWITWSSLKHPTESTLRKIFYTSHLTHYWDTHINWFLWPRRQTAFIMPSLPEEVHLKQGWWHLIS